MKSFLTTGLLASFLLTLLCCQTTYEIENTDSLATINQALLDSLSDRRITLPNGWSLTPVGQSVPLGDFPMNMTVSHDQSRLAITNNGQSTQQIMLYDLVNQQLLDSIPIRKSWLGIHFAPDDQSLYVSGGNDNVVKQYDLNNDELSLRDSIVLGEPWPNRISVAGLDINASDQLLYAVTKDDSALYVADLTGRSVQNRYELPHEAYTCLYDSTRQRLYISLWGGAQVAVFDTQQQTFLSPIDVETHPNDMVITQDARYLFVANANANSVSVIDLDQSKAIETISASLYPDAPIGSTSNSVALSPDERYLYIANADNNCLSVFERVGAGAQQVGRVYSYRLVSHQCARRGRPTLRGQRQRLLPAGQSQGAEPLRAAHRRNPVHRRAATRHPVDH